MMPDAQQIGAALRERRQELAMPPEAVADALDLDRTSISRKERGIVGITVVEFWRWCAVLDLVVDIREL